MSRHLLIAAATCRYPHLKVEDARPQLAEVLSSMVELFTGKLRIYERQLADIGEDPQSDALRRALDNWFGDPGRDPSDWVVFYYTGHAEVVGTDSLYLITSDFVPFQYVSTAFSLRQLADVVLARLDDRRPRRVRNLLVIVDTCFAGAGTTQLAEDLASAFRRSSGQSFYVLGAALPRQVATAGALARALIGALDELSGRYVMQEWLYLEQIVPEINRRLGGVHDAVWSAMDSAQEAPRFFPNPAFVDTSGGSVPANEAQRAISEQEFRMHWSPRARGVEFDEQPGSYFRGREKVLASLTDFLRNPADSRTRVVTGRPGSGKSAILARLVMSSEAGSGEFPRVDLAIHAKGKTANAVAGRMAGLLGVEANEESILEALRRSSRSVCIVVDALDEALQPSAIAQRLLRPLNAIASAKLIVGTRAGELPALQGAEVIDIDLPENVRRDDIADYIEARLLGSAEPSRPTLYAARENLARIVARRVSEAAYPNFLMARLIVEDLLSRPEPVSAEEIAKLKFPSSVADAFDDWLSRFNEEATAVQDLLLPLAFAEGEGLPWDNIWAPLASGLSGREYSDADIRWLLEKAGAFILEAADEGRSVYRLYHQALADALRRKKRERRVHETFTRVLREAVPRRPKSSEPDWLVASRYTRLHLAAHAGRSGQLAGLLRDPLYLLAADAERLLATLGAYGADVPREIVNVYQSAVHHIRREAPGGAAAYLALAAYQRGVEAFARQSAELPLEADWRPLWAFWNPETPCQFFGKGDSEICALEPAVWGERTIALVGRKSGAAEVWDVGRGQRIAVWHPDGMDWVKRLAFADTAEGPLLISSWFGGKLGVLHLDSAEARYARADAGGDDNVNALAVVERNGEWVCATAHSDLRLVLRSLPSLEPVAQIRRTREGQIYGLRQAFRGNEALLLSVGDSLLRREEDPEDEKIDQSMVRVWSLDDFSLLWEDRSGEEGAMHYASQTPIAGRMWTVLSQDSWAPPEIWDLETGRRAWRGEIPTKRSWIYEYQGEPLLLSVYQGQFSALRLQANREFGESFTAEPFAEPIPILGEDFTDTIKLHGRSVILSQQFDHVRVWDIDELLESLQKGPAESIHAPDARALPTLPDQPDVVYAGALGRVLLLDRESGAKKSEWPLEPEELARALDGAPARNWMAVATSKGYIHVFDAGTGVRLRTISAGRWLGRMQTLRWSGRDLAFVTVGNSAWQVRAWDLDTGEQVSEDDAYRLYSGQEDKWMDGLALFPLPVAVRIAYSSKYSKVMVGRFPRGQGPDSWRSPPEWRIPNGDGEYVRALAAQREPEALLAAGTERGHMVIWRLGTGQEVASRAAAHLGNISALMFGTLGGNIGGERVLVSGGADATVRVWSLDLNEMLRVDVSEEIQSMILVGPGRLALGTRRGVLMLEFNAARILEHDRRQNPPLN